MFPFVGYAYSEKTTHPALTEDIIEFFNAHYPDSALTNGEKKHIIDGSVHEDEGTRALHHFYDPVHDRGLVLAGKEFMSAKEWAEDTLAQASYRKNIAANPLDALFYGTVRHFYRSDTDFSFDRAVYEYAWGDRKHALRALGHALHLLEDMAVPAHTRNDPHPPLLHFGSPYEAWAKRFGPENTDIARELAGKEPVLLPRLGEYFDAVSKYSNNNFFSKDTTPDKKNTYKNPEIEKIKSIELSDGKIYQFGYRTKFEYKLALIKVDTITLKKEYFILDPDSLILSDYWSLLSEHAVLHGAGAVKLFFDEVAEEKRTKALYKKNRTWAERLYDATEERLYNLADALYGISVPYGELNESQEDMPPPVRPDPPPAEADEGVAVSEETAGAGELSDTEQSPEQDALHTVLPTNVIEPPAVGPSTQLGTGNVEPPAVSQIGPSLGATPYYPGFGGGRKKSPTVETPPEGTEESASPAQSVPESGDNGEDAAAENDGEETAGGDAPSGESEGNDEDKEDTEPPVDVGAEPPAADEAEPPDTTPPAPPVILGPTAGKTVFTENVIQFFGEAEASSTVSAALFSEGATTTHKAVAEADGYWEFVLQFGQGTGTVSFVAEDTAGNVSSSTERTIFVDSHAPDVELWSDTCAGSLAEDVCLVSTTTLAFAWRADAPDLDYFIVRAADGALSTTTATSSIISADDNTLYEFSVAAVDRFGNESAPKALAVEVRTRPVVINEIAWMGTEASSADEWIELRSLSSAPIAFDETWVLYSASDDTPTIPLSGTIPAHGYYLIERKNGGETDEELQSPVADVPADLWTSFSFGLRDNGEELVLARGSTTVDKVHRCSPARWCGGESRSGSKRTMERFDPLVGGENWVTNDGYITNGVDTDGGKISGTPKAQNSAAHRIVPGFFISRDMVLTKARSPYLVAGRSFTIGREATLTVEPGVVVKFTGERGRKPSFVASGKLIAEGTVEEPIVFTSFADDEYGGDLNADGMCGPHDASSTSACPASGDWGQILFRGEDSRGSVLRHVLVRYGGSLVGPDHSLSASVAGSFTEVSLDRAVVEYSGKHGLCLLNSTSTILHSTFRFAERTAGAYGGACITEGASEITGSIFEENAFGLSVRNSPASTAAGNTFRKNALDAVVAFGHLGTFSGNSGSENGTNAIVLKTGRFGERGATTTLAANPLSYLIEGSPRVAASSTLAFEDGVVVKASGEARRRAARIFVEDGGKLFHDGDSPESLVFTSMHDDSVGSAVDTSTTSPKAGDWFGIIVTDGGILDMGGFTLRYGGGVPFRGGGTKGGVHIACGEQCQTAGATSTVRRALFERNDAYGLALSGGARLLVEDTAFVGHPAWAAVGISGSTAELRNVSFAGNALDVRVLGAPSAVIADWATKKSASSTDPEGLFD